MDENPTYEVLTIALQTTTNTGGFNFMAPSLPIEECHGYVDEDLLSWLTQFEDNFNITRDSKVQDQYLDQVKETHLIVKLRESARSRINSLTPEQKQSFKDIVELHKRLLLYIRSTVFMTQLIQLDYVRLCTRRRKYESFLSEIAETETYFFARI